MESPMGTVSHVPLYSVKWGRTSACPVALDPECVKVQLNEPGYRFQISGLDITTPIICYGNVQRATVFVDALQRSLDRERRPGILLSGRCSKRQQTANKGTPGISRFWNEVSSCQRISTSVPTKCGVSAHERQKGGDAKLHTAKNIEHSERTLHSARLRCEEMRLILWNGDSYLTRRRNRTGLLDPPPKQRSQ